MSTAARRLGEFAVELKYEDLPEAVVTAAKLHLLDTLGCGLAAHALDEAPFVQAAAAEAARCGGSTAIGMSGGLPPAEAALVNGTLFHALDYDDTHPESVVHVSAAVVPAALAAGEVSGATGRELVCALIAGNETSIRLGMAAGGQFHARGLHPTGVCGVFGATVTAARLRQLDAEQTTNALGIAGSMAGGLLEFLADGSKTKPLHPGWAAHSALNAVRLVAHGATGPSTVLDGQRGLFAAYLHGIAPALDSQLSDLGTRFETPRIAYKPYPACHYVHAPIDALAQLVEAEDLTPTKVESITAFSDETGVSLVLHPLEDKLRPRTVYDAKFSLPFCLAALLVYGRVDVASFTREAIADPRVLAVAAQVDYKLKDYAPAPDAFPGGVRVRTRDGRLLEAELRYQRGAEQNPMTRQDCVRKYRANAERALDADDVALLERAVLALEEEDGPHAFSLLARAQRL